MDQELNSRLQPRFLPTWQWGRLSHWKVPLNFQQNPNLEGLKSCFLLFCGSCFSPMSWEKNCHPFSLWRIGEKEEAVSFLQVRVGTEYQPSFAVIFCKLSKKELSKSSGKGAGPSSFHYESRWKVEQLVLEGASPRHARGLCPLEPFQAVWE